MLSSLEMMQGRHQHGDFSWGESVATATHREAIKAGLQYIAIGSTADYIVPMELE